VLSGKRRGSQHHRWHCRAATWRCGRKRHRCAGTKGAQWVPLHLYRHVGEQSSCQGQSPLTWPTSYCRQRRHKQDLACMRGASRMEAYGEWRARGGGRVRTSSGVVLGSPECSSITPSDLWRFWVKLRLVPCAKNVPSASSSSPLPPVLFHGQSCRESGEGVTQGCAVAVPRPTHSESAQVRPGYSVPLAVQYRPSTTI